MSNRVKVVIIDTGVNDRSIKGVCFSLNGEHVVLSSQIDDDIGHGTGIFNIIKKHCAASDIYAIKLCGKGNQKPDIKLLFHALEYIYSNIDCHIINISLSIAYCDYERYLDKLELTCKKLYEKNVIIVSAFDNYGSISYPAAFPDVLGIVSGEYCSKTTQVEYVQDENKIINYAGFGKSQSVVGKDGKYYSAEGNSLACAHISGILASKYIFGCEYNMQNIFQLLNEYVVHKHYYPKNDVLETQNKYNGKNVNIVLLGKEIYNILRYESMLCFHIKGVYDSRFSGMIHKTVSEIPFQNINSKIVINDIEEIDLKNCDMVLIGHIGVYDTCKKALDSIHNMLIKCIKQNIKIFSFDELCEYFHDIPPETYETSNIKINSKIWSPFGKLYRISKPILGVFGTSSQQGKFTLQLELRKRFLSNGYNVGQIGTEPSSIFYGMDFCFHYGHNSNPEITRFDTVSLLNAQLNHLVRNGADILIVGGQSALIPEDYGNLQFITIPQIEFYLATNPDVVIMCINETDSFTYITDTISFIHSVSNGRVIAFVINPLTIKINSTNQYEKCFVDKKRKKELTQQLKKKFKIPAYYLDSKESIDKLFNDIIFYLT